MRSNIQLPTFVPDRTDIRRIRGETSRIRDGNTEQQVVRGIDIIVEIKLYTVFQGGEIKAEVQCLRRFPLQVFISDPARGNTRRDLISPGSIVASQECHIGIIADTVVTRHTPGSSQFQ